MKHVSRFAVWLIWNLAYIFRRRPRDLDELLLKGKRCCCPFPSTEIEATIDEGAD